MEWKDGKCRCRWANPRNERYIRYHDEEWGSPVHDDKKLFEMLILESFQAGLSWECILNKREAFFKAFDGFDLEKVCAYDEEKERILKENAGIVRNLGKIRAAVVNARIFRKIQEEYGSFDGYLWALDRWKGDLREWTHLFGTVRPDIRRSQETWNEVRGYNHYLRLSAGSRNYMGARGWVLFTTIISRVCTTVFLTFFCTVYISYTFSYLF